MRSRFIFEFGVASELQQDQLEQSNWWATTFGALSRITKIFFSTEDLHFNKNTKIISLTSSSNSETSSNPSRQKFQAPKKERISNLQLSPQRFLRDVPKSGLTPLSHVTENDHYLRGSFCHACVSAVKHSSPTPTCSAQLLPSLFPEAKRHPVSRYEIRDDRK